MSYITVWDEEKKRWDMRVASPTQRMHLLFNPEIRVLKPTEVINEYCRSKLLTAPRRLRAAWLAVKAAFTIYQYAMEAGA